MQYTPEQKLRFKMAEQILADGANQVRQKMATEIVEALYPHMNPAVLLEDDIELKVLREKKIEKVKYILDRYATGI